MTILNPDVVSATWLVQHCSNLPEEMVLLITRSTRSKPSLASPFSRKMFCINGILYFEWYFLEAIPRVPVVGGSAELLR